MGRAHLACRRGTLAACAWSGYMHIFLVLRIHNEKTAAVLLDNRYAGPSGAVSGHVDWDLVLSVSLVALLASDSCLMPWLWAGPMHENYTAVWESFCLASISPIPTKLTNNEQLGIIVNSEGASRVDVTDSSSICMITRVLLFWINVEHSSN